MEALNLEKIKSVLTLDKMYVESFEFKRDENTNFSENLSFKLGKNICKIADNKYKVVLNCKIEWSSECNLNLAVCGLFIVSDEIINDDIIFRNTCSIIFPYLRSQITILTSQPDFPPFVLPVININLLFDEMEKNK